MNSVQVSGINSGNVRVCVPYPGIISGTPDEVGIQNKAFELIDKIISAIISDMKRMTI
jgi:hypothetical protein